MCGITGYVGNRDAVETVLTNLKRLEYRGYDSSGVAFIGNEDLCVVRAEGRISNLENVLALNPQLSSHIAIAHTRWATHGKPCEMNSHPHTDCTGKVAVVHNGIIENYLSLRSKLVSSGHTFHSETDTETIAHLIEEALNSQIVPDFQSACRTALKQMEGSYAVAALCTDWPEEVFIARKDSPLVIGLGDGETLIASDIPAVMRYTRQVIVMQDGDCALITPEGITLMGVDGTLVDRSPICIDWDDQAAEKSGYDHFMMKEIHENAITVKNTLRGRIDDHNRVKLPTVSFTPEQWMSFKHVRLIGCGTAYNACLAAKRLLEHLLRRPVEADYASEYRYSDPIVDKNTLVVLVSQSGETADTLAAMRLSNAMGATTLGVVNVVGSTLAREADGHLLTQAGPEVGVASTKAYLAQLTALALLGVHLAQQCGSDATAIESEIVAGLRMLPELVDECLSRECQIEKLAHNLLNSSAFFFLGRGYDYATAMEAALKLKEISYINAEAYPAGEMKHGPLALVEPGVTIVGLCTQDSTNDKMMSNLQEVKARQGTIVALIRDNDTAPDCADYVIRVPSVPSALMPILAIVPLQILAYHVARLKGCSIDQPRNLAKSVTVE